MPAVQADPIRFAGVDPNYITTSNQAARRAAFYGPDGSFDPALLALDEATKDTVALGELFSLGTAITTAANFTGPVFTVNGVDDTAFCNGTPDCGLANEINFYPKASDVQFCKCDLYSVLKSSAN